MNTNMNSYDDIQWKHIQNMFLYPGLLFLMLLKKRACIQHLTTHPYM